ncbi:hypothetical protein RJ641_006051 [Dillenia turbinata]|uniref:Uncharacterized protein n=1 Tax=Dillenia turbinata TaxID=194707 RepID=A0AAN8V4P0_9MAGN
MACTLEYGKDEGRVEILPILRIVGVSTAFSLPKITIDRERRVRVRAKDYRRDPDTFTYFTPVLYLRQGKDEKPMPIPYKLVCSVLETYERIVFKISIEKKRRVRVTITGIKSDGSSVKIFNKIGFRVQIVVEENLLVLDFGYFVQSSLE